MATTENEAIGRLMHLWGMYKTADPKMGEALDIAIKKLSFESPYAQAADDMYEALEALLKAMERYFDEYGAIHEDGCPEDDTCTCAKVGAINKAWTNAYNATRRARGEE